MFKINVTQHFIESIRKHKIHLISGGEQWLHDEISLEGPIQIHGSLSGILSFGRYSYLGGPGYMSHCHIGRFCSIAGGVTAGLGNHPTSWLSSSNLQYGKALWAESSFVPALNFPTISLTEIGNDVWIGQGAFLKTGVKISTGAIVGARSVVTKDVPPYAIVAGSPAKIIRFRFPERVIDTLLRSNWWSLSLDQLQGCPFDDVYAAIDFLEALEKHPASDNEPITKNIILQSAGDPDV